MTTMATTITMARQPLQDIFILNMQIHRLKYSEKQPSDIEFIIHIDFPYNYFMLYGKTFHEFVVMKLRCN